MSSLSAERLYRLLPSLYRIRDAQQGYPLRELVSIMAEQCEALEENLEQLYDDQFIETCADWVAPYIGDLIGYRPLHGVLPALASPRAEVANTIAYRRRKGSAAMLEQLARDVTGWPARAAEFFEQLATTQYLNHLRPHARATAELRSTRLMLQRGGPFSTVAHTAEMRRPEAGSGRYNIPNIGLFLWRLLPCRLSGVPLTPDALDAGGRKFRFNPLGADQRLFRLPLTETHVTHIARPENVPDPLSLRLMAAAARAAPGAAHHDDYGVRASVVLTRPGAPGAPPDPVERAQIRICDLRDVAAGWAHEATLAPDMIAIDPERGRVLLGSAALGPLAATFHTGFARQMGGGEYQRSPAGAQLAVQRRAAAGAALQPHLDAVAAGGRLVLDDSHTYRGAPVFKVDAPAADGAGLEVVVAARNGARPLLAAEGPFALQIGARGRLVLDGLVLSGAALHLARAPDDEARELVLRDCTLVPGLAHNPDGSAVAPGQPSLVVEHPYATLTLERCISGPLRVAPDAKVFLHDCIVDAGDAATPAFDADGAGGPGAELTVTDSTVLGKLHARLLRLASNSLFVAAPGAAPDAAWPAPMMAERRQEGCVRFCYLPPGAIVPRRYRCAGGAGATALVPHFTSLRYGDPGYAQLRGATGRAIAEGADDGGEMGVMHALFQPQREANLRLRLDEYLRFGLHAGIFYVT